MINKNKINPLSYIFIILACFLALFPILWMILMSIKNPTESLGSIKSIIPTHPTLQNFYHVSLLIPIWKNFMNSMIVSLAGSFLTVIFCSLAGFAFAKYKFPGREALFLLLIATMMVPPETSVIPVFLIMRKLGWINKLISLIIPRAATAVGIFYMRQYITSFPDSLMEQSRIDGCSEFRIYWNMVIPVVTPALAAWGSITLIARWNELLWPLLFMRTSDKYTLMVSLSQLPVSEGLSTPWPVIMAGATISVIPLIIMYFILQKFQISGLTAGSTKG